MEQIYLVNFLILCSQQKVTVILSIDLLTAGGLCRILYPYRSLLQFLQSVTYQVGSAGTLLCL